MIFLTKHCIPQVCLPHPLQIWFSVSFWQLPLKERDSKDNGRDYRECDNAVDGDPKRGYIADCFEEWKEHWVKCVKFDV